jgi:probable rRNA maturation factor
MRSGWEKMKEHILGKKFSLSVVYADDKLIKKLNKKYRKINKATNVLSFPLSKNEGEIFINIPLAKKEAKKSKISEKKYIDYLFIHSLLHLSGYRHGKKMQEKEKQITKKFKINIF